ncbi:MAG: cell wall-binding repeat-containing protein [Euzebya sp.]
MITTVMVGLAGVPTAASAGQFGPDTLAIVKDDAGLGNAEIAVALSQDTPLPDTDSVLIGRDDEFADSLASGVLQATSPLLLVPREGPVPALVRDELTRLGPSRVILLGGEAALTPAVADELSGLGYTVERRAGDSRFETATDIAQQDAATADTAILARAFAAPGATDPTQGFADALAAGGLAAERGWPVLLTQSDVLTAPTRDYLIQAGITNVKLMGGTAAISVAVEQELGNLGISTQRLAGDSRSQTAIEVAKERGAETADDAARVLLVQAQTADAWAGGFAAAAHSALFDAPVVLAVGEQLAPETEQWLGGSAAFAQDGSEVRITCVVVPSVCERGRVALGLPPSPPPAQSADPIASYSFESLNSDVPGAPALSPLTQSGNGPNVLTEDPVEGPILEFPDGNGLRLGWQDGFLSTDSYTIAMRMAVDDTSGYVRLLDFSERQSDNGLYLYDGVPVFYGLVGGSGTVVTAGVYATIVLTRSSAGEIVGYVDGEQAFSTTDSDNSSVLANNAIIVFQDDLVVTNETSSGQITSFQVFDSALTAQQVAAL